LNWETVSVATSCFLWLPDMLLSIRHETSYHYSAPIAYSIQQLHLTPRLEAHQHVQSWHLSCPGHRHEFIDAYNNVSHILTRNWEHSANSIVVEGVVRIEKPYRGQIQEASPQSPLVFTVSTRLTEPTAAILDFAALHFNPVNKQADSGDLLQLAEAICATVSYQSGATGVTTTAHDALVLGQGVCQDHAHLFLACCHSRGIPARYVSGYIDPESTAHAASHAWVDVWLEESAYQGWVSLDVTHARLMTDAYCRLAIGRDYDSAAPISGVRKGGGHEELTVAVRVIPL
jgi:transglutaminase-like putative cysteine protease